MDINIKAKSAKIAETVLKVVTLVLSKANIQSNSINEVKTEVDDSGITVTLPSHYAFIDSGRKPGRRPPASAILKWMSEERISIPSGMKPKQFAFLVARSIGRRGIKPRPFINKLGEEIANIIADFISTEINNSKTIFNIK